MLHAPQPQTFFGVQFMKDASLSLDPAVEPGIGNNREFQHGAGLGMQKEKLSPILLAEGLPRVVLVVWTVKSTFQSYDTGETASCVFCSSSEVSVIDQMTTLDRAPCCSGETSQGRVRMRMRRCSRGFSPRSRSRLDKVFAHLPHLLFAWRSFNKRLPIE